MTERAFDVGKDSGVMNQTAEATEVTNPGTVEMNNPSNGATLEAVADAADNVPQADSNPSHAPSNEVPANSLSEKSSTEGAHEAAADAPNPKVSDPKMPSGMAMIGEAAQTPPTGVATAQDSSQPDLPNAPASSSDSTGAESGESGESAKKTRAPRTAKTPGKPVEAGGSIATIVERVVRMTTLTDEHAAALGRLFHVSLPEDYVARLTRLTGASLGPIGNSASEALGIVLGLESANPIHVGVQLGRLAATALPDVYRCVHALTGEPAPALPKGDNAVFAVADVLATLTSDDFALARALSTALE